MGSLLKEPVWILYLLKLRIAQYSTGYSTVLCWSVPLVGQYLHFGGYRIL